MDFTNTDIILFIILGILVAISLAVAIYYGRKR
jgi:LPXTG-motif cell wall-anchored protein